MSNYKAGYKNPPKNTRFKKGQSGNPTGRPKGSRGHDRTIAELLDEEITAMGGEKPVRMTKREATGRILMKKALKDENMKAIEKVIAMDPRSKELPAVQNPSHQQIGAKNAVEVLEARLNEIHSRMTVSQEGECPHCHRQFSPSK